MKLIIDSHHLRITQHSIFLPTRYRSSPENATKDFRDRESSKPASAFRVHIREYSRIRASIRLQAATPCGWGLEDPEASQVYLAWQSSTLSRPEKPRREERKRRGEARGRTRSARCIAGNANDKRNEPSRPWTSTPANCRMNDQNRGSARS